MSPVLTLADSEVGIAITVGLILVAVVSMITNTFRKSSQTRQREETKRELAAYVAEGSMTPEQAEKILQADLPHLEKRKCC